MTTADHAVPLEWDEVARRLQAERTVWLGTVGPDGSPHAAPVWLAVFDDDVYVFTSGASAKARNLLGNPRCVMHVGDGEDVLIVNGRLEFIGDPQDFRGVMAVFAEKYRDPGDAEFLPGQDPTADALFRLVPGRVMCWRLEEYLGSQRRWSST
jgi:PPOX class probable F420-dependent enzyme